MNAAEHRTVQRAKALLRAGDRSGALAALTALSAPKRRADLFEEGQLVMQFATFRCEKLGADDVPVHVCVTRQRITDVQRTQQASRGQGTNYPSCDTRTCELGRRIREAVDPDGAVRWRGSGPGGRWRRERSQAEKKRQNAARAKAERVGLGPLDQVPSIDAEPEEAEG